MSSRPSILSCMMEDAINWSRRSTCSRLNVGCVIANQDLTQIAAIGYNGRGKGLSNKPISNEPGKTGMIHAEANALIKANYDLPNKIMFVTHSPCQECAEKILNGNIKTIFYREQYRNTEPLNDLVKCNIGVYQLLTNGSVVEFKSGKTVKFKLEGKCLS